MFCPLVAKEGLPFWWLCVQGIGLDTALGEGDVIPGWEELQWLVQGLKVTQCLSPDWPLVPPNSGLCPFCISRVWTLPPPG